MHPALESVLNGKALLIALAAPAEARAVLRVDAPAPWSLAAVGPSCDVLVTGVGKVNAAGAVAHSWRPERHGAVLSLGVAGVLPGGGLEIGGVVIASACVYADEGVETPTGFIDCAAMGFPLGDFAGSAIPMYPPLTAALLAACPGAITARVATVSTCSGTNARAATVAARTGAVAEAMEGAAVAHVASRLGAPAGELRVISNTTGDRAAQRWDLPTAMAVLSRTVDALIGLR